MKIQIIYALPQSPIVVECEVNDNCSVMDAITSSNILNTYNIKLEDHKVGIYGKTVELTTQLLAGDRIEIYRHLINDPKEIRRKRANLI